MLCVLLSLTATAAIAKERTPPGSFLRYRATTVSELLGQVAQDSVVRARYARHFNVAPDKVASYIGSGLNLVTLKEPIKVHAWYVDADGRNRVKTKLLPKGSLVFCSADGKPSLLWSCGNPLRSDIPMKVAKTEQKVASSVQQIENPIIEPEAKVLAGPPEVVGVEPMAAAPDFIPVAAVEPLPVIPTAAPTLGPAMPAIGTIAGLGALGGLVALLGSDSPGSPVPEPSGLIALATGVSATGMTLLRMRRRRK